MIYKYPLNAITTKLYLNNGYKVLTAQLQNNQIVVWVDNDPYQPLEPVEFSLVTTGSNPPPNSTYLSTIQQGDYVIHVYTQVQTNVHHEV